MIKSVTKKEMSQVMRKIKKEFGIKFARTQGVCCNSCTGAILTDKAVDDNYIYVKHFENGLNKDDWYGDRMCIAYAAELGLEKVNKIAKRMVEILKDDFGYEYYTDELEDTYTTIVLVNMNFFDGVLEKVKYYNRDIKGKVLNIRNGSRTMGVEYGLEVVELLVSVSLDKELLYGVIIDDKGKVLKRYKDFDDFKMDVLKNSIYIDYPSTIDLGNEPYTDEKIRKEFDTNE